MDQFEAIVTDHYEALFRFAMSLTQAESDARDLTQQTFYIWARKGHQLRDISKVRSWLHTTLHRAFLESRRRLVRFPHCELEQASAQLPVLDPDFVDRLDSAQVVSALAGVDEVYQSAVALFYLEDCSYQDIADILEVPIGTVKSRIARGIAQLRQSLLSVKPRASSPDQPGIACAAKANAPSAPPQTAPHPSRRRVPPAAEAPATVTRSGTIVLLASGNRLAPNES